MFSTGLRSFQFLPSVFLSINFRAIQQPSLFHLYPAVKVNLAAGQGGSGGGSGWGRRIEGISLEEGWEMRGGWSRGWLGVRPWRTHNIPFLIVWDQRPPSLCKRVSPTGAARSGAVIDSLSAGPYIRRREVGVPATVLPQVLQRCGCKSIQSGL